jgi:hypothetical protein
MRAYARTSILLFVLRDRRVAFKDKIFLRRDAAVSPHPNPLPVGEGKDFATDAPAPGTDSIP